MAKLADYKILHDHARTLKAGSNPNTGNHELLLHWKRPKRFVKGAGEQQPLLTFQIWTHTVTALSMQFEYGGLSGGRRVWKGFPSGQLIVGCAPFNGEAMANDGIFRIVADDNSKFTIDLVKIDFQRRR